MNKVIGKLEIFISKSAIIQNFIFRIFKTYKFFQEKFKNKENNIIFMGLIKTYA